MARTLAVSFLVLCGLTGLVLAGETPSTIRSIDFKNFSLPWDSDMEDPPSYGNSSPWFWLETPQSRIQVREGRHRFDSPELQDVPAEQRPLLTVNSVVYGDLDGDQLEEAAVSVMYHTGGTQTWSYVYVYKMARHHPELLGVLKSGSRADGGLYRTAIENGLLVLDFGDSDRRIADCCSEGYIRVHYRWKQSTFVEEGQRERGDIKLNEQ